MVLKSLGSGLQSLIRKVSKSSRVDKELIDSLCKELQKLLLQADVNVHIVLEITKKIKARAYESLEGINKQEQLQYLIYEELASILGSDAQFELQEKNRILLIGLYGQGKTTSSAKLASYFQKRNKKVALCSLDVWRPAACEQLQQLALQEHIDFFGNPKATSPKEILNAFTTKDTYDLVLYDSAGRDILSQELLDELLEIIALINPTDIFLTIGADVGQNAKKQAEFFKQHVSISGVIITKLDGTAKGGGALSACAALNVPVYFIGLGEKISDLERFNAQGFVGQLLGMGDLHQLLDRVQGAMQTQEETKKLEEKIARGELDLEDFHAQLQQMNKIGNLKRIASFIPGFSQLSSQVDMESEEAKMKRWKYAIDSMTAYEKQKPESLNTQRLSRISKGSGVQEGEIRDMLKKFKDLKKMLRMFKSEDMSNMENIDIQKLAKKLKHKLK